MTEKHCLPLLGRRILVTRAKEQAQSFVKRIVDLGGEAICFPVLAIKPPTDPKTIADIEAAISQLTSYDWIIFTSANGVNYFFERLQSNQSSIYIADRTNVVAIGPETANALKTKGIASIFPAADYQQEGLVELLGPRLKQGDKVLLPTAAVTRSYLRSKLREMGADVTQVTVYENVYNEGPSISGAEELESAGESTFENQSFAEAGAVGKAIIARGDQVTEMLHAGDIDAVPLTSSSSVIHLLEFLERQGVHYPQQLLNNANIVCIGAITARTADEAGLHVKRMAQEATMASLVEAIVECYK